MVGAGIFAFITWLNNFIVRAEGSLLNIVVSLPCTAYQCGSLTAL